MKRSLYLTHFVLALTLMSGHLFAATKTKVEGASQIPPNIAIFAGEYSSGTETVTGGNVTISKDDKGSDLTGYYVVGSAAYSEARDGAVTMLGGEVGSIAGSYIRSVMRGSAYDGEVIMRDGEVQMIWGCQGVEEASGGYVLMTGGKAGYVYGGEASYRASGIEDDPGIISKAYNNNVVVAGGEITLNVIAGKASGSADEGICSNNHVYLVGNGYTGTVVEGKEEVTGSSISIGGFVRGNDVHVYGTGINIGTLDSDVSCKFHITNSLYSSSSPMLTLTKDIPRQYNDGYDPWFTSSQPFFTFVNEDVVDWTQFSDKSITLISADWFKDYHGLFEEEITIVSKEGKSVATAILRHQAGSTSMELTNIAPVYTGTIVAPILDADRFTIIDSAYFGKYSTSENITGGTAAVASNPTGLVPEDAQVFGGYTEKGDVSSCNLVMFGGNVFALVGGMTKAGEATNNGISMGDGKAAFMLVGGISEAGNANNNTVNIGGGEVLFLDGGMTTGRGNASSNKVTMTGGCVKESLFGGHADTGNATKNTVIVSAGSVGWLSGGYADTGNATNNTVIVRGGTVERLYGGYSFNGNSTDNSVLMVGEGATYNFYDGSTIEITGSVYAGYTANGGPCANNSVSVYGTGISIGGTIVHGSCQSLNFHLVDAQADEAATPMLTLGSALDLNGVKLGFFGEEVTSWASFAGKSITLVSMTSDTVSGVMLPSCPVDIMDAEGTTVATATLSLESTGKALMLAFAPSTEGPGTNPEEKEPGTTPGTNPEEKEPGTQGPGAKPRIRPTVRVGIASQNGRAGIGMLDAALEQIPPQDISENSDLLAVVEAIGNGVNVDQVATAMSGASAAAMGAAWNADVERQLRAIRNRTTTMGLAECQHHEELPYFNAWMNAEGDYRTLRSDNGFAGYKMSSWGGTVGMDIDFSSRFTAGLAFTAMHGKFTAKSAEMAEGDLDRMYVSAFARYAYRAWTHTFVATLGVADTELKRTVDYGTGDYTARGGSDGSSFGLMYETGYTLRLNAEASTCLQPLFNISYRHSNLGGYAETGSDAALHLGDATTDVVSFGLGTRLQSVVGTSVYNRASLFEGRVLVKLDAGDRDTSRRASFLGVQDAQAVKSAEYGTFSMELGAGLVVPLGHDGCSMFFDVSADFCSGYTDVNGTVGYRFNF